MTSQAKQAVTNQLEKKQETFNPQQKQYLYLSKKGRQKYTEISRQAYKAMLMWSAVGIIGGYTIYKFHPYVKFLRRYPKFGKTMFIVSSVMFSYHGYKLMIYMKKKGTRELGKIPEYQLTQEEYEKEIREGNHHYQ